MTSLMKIIMQLELAIIHNIAVDVVIIVNVYTAMN